MSSGQILVIDESKEIARHLTQDLLSELGFRAFQAFDGHSGLDLIRNQEPDLVLLALKLPDISGLEVLQILRRESVNVPVILMATSGSEKSVAEGFRLGIIDYLVKPFTEVEVTSALRLVFPEFALQAADEPAAPPKREFDFPPTPEQHAAADLPDEDLQKQLRQIRLLFGIGKAVTSLLSVEQILERVLDAATFLTEAEESVVWLPESKSGTLRAYARKSDSDDGQILTISMHDSQVAQVLRTGRPQRLNSAEDGLKLQTGYLARALMSVPLSVSGKVVGVLSVINRLDPRVFSERDEYLLTSLADYAAIALHNARIYQSTDRELASRADELRTLIEITRQFTSTLDLQEIVQRTLQQVHNSWHVECSALWLLDGQRQVLQLMNAIGAEAGAQHAVELPLEQGILGYVARSGQTTSTNDADSHPFYEPAIDGATGVTPHTLMCVPLTLGTYTVGVLQLVNRQSGLFEEADVERAQTLGAAVAIALRNGLDYQWLTEQHRELEERLNTIRSTALKLKQQATLDEESDALLSSIIRESTQVSALATGILALPDRLSLQ